MRPNPQMPAHEVIGTITKLSEGFVLTIRGKTVACRNAKELGQQVEKATKKLKKLPEPEAPSWSAQQAPQFTPEQVAAMQHDVLRQEQQIATVQDAATEIQTQLTRVLAMARARAQGLIDGDAFMEGVERYCPDLSGEAISQALDQAEREREQIMAGQAPPCACAEGPCVQNVSIPNAQGLCQACHKGEHLHPTRMNRGKARDNVVPFAQQAPDLEEPEDDSRLLEPLPGPEFVETPEDAEMAEGPEYTGRE